MNRHFPEHHVPYDHFAPMFYLPYDDSRFGTKAQMDTVWIMLSAADEDCHACGLDAVKAMTDGDVETVLVLMRVVTFWVSARIWPAVGSDEETHWRNRLTNGWSDDNRPVAVQREGVIGEMCRKYLNSLPNLEDRNDDYRIARAEHWEAVRKRGS